MSVYNEALQTMINSYKRAENYWYSLQYAKDISQLRKMENVPYKITLKWS